MIDLPVVTIDPKIFLTFVSEELFNEFNRRGNAEEVIRSFCTSVNKFRTGEEVIGYLPEYRFKRMTFHNCVVTKLNGEEFTLKSHKNHVDLWGTTCTIWLTEERKNRLEITPKEIKWVCVKDSKKVFPKCGAELLKQKYGEHGLKNVTALLTVYDDYVKIFLEEYEKHIREAS